MVGWRVWILVYGDLNTSDIWIPISDLFAVQWDAQQWAARLSREWRVDYEEDEE